MPEVDSNVPMEEDKPVEEINENDKPEAPAEEAIDEVSENDKMQAIWAYVLCIPYLTKSYEKSEFIKFHLNQAIVLWALMLGVNLVGWLLLYLKPFGAVLYFAINVAFLAGLVFGIFAASDGEKKEIPLVGKLFTAVK